MESKVRALSNCSTESFTVENANLPKLYVQCANLSGAAFRDVNMSGTFITDANLSDLEIDGAQLGGAYIHNIGLPPKGHPAYREDQGAQRPLRFDSCELTGTTISNCDLSGVTVDGCKMDGLKIDGVDISALLRLYRSAPERFGELAASKPRFGTPLLSRTGSTFVPVRDIVDARDWYCRILGFAVDEAPIHNGHLCPLPLEGSGVILDTMPMWGGREPDGPPTYQTPAFMLLADDLQEAYSFLKEQGAEMVTDIENNHWFAFRDPDGNMLMVCRA